MRGINSLSNKNNTFLRYAKIYDVLNADKDYKKESIYIDSLVNKFIEKPKNEIRILDLACGTGKHALEFYDLGYIVEGSDISKEMIKNSITPETPQVCADSNRLPFASNSIDVFLMMNIFCKLSFFSPSFSI